MQYLPLDTGQQRLLTWTARRTQKIRGVPVRTVWGFGEQVSCRWHNSKPHWLTCGIVLDRDKRSLPRNFASSIPNVAAEALGVHRSRIRNVDVAGAPGNAPAAVVTWDVQNPAPSTQSPSLPWWLVPITPEPPLATNVPDTRSPPISTPVPNTFSPARQTPVPQTPAPLFSRASPVPNTPSPAAQTPMPRTPSPPAQTPVPDTPTPLGGGATAFPAVPGGGGGGGEGGLPGGTQWPTAYPRSAGVGGDDDEVWHKKEWPWILIGIGALLLLCACCLFAFFARKRKKKAGHCNFEDMEKSQQLAPMLEADQAQRDYLAQGRDQHRHHHRRGGGGKLG